MSSGLALCEPATPRVVGRRGFISRGTDSAQCTTSSTFCGMVLDTTTDSKYFATALAVEVLDELRVSVLECLLALDVIGEEATIDFEPLLECLAVSGRAARQAFVAASLLHQDAELTAPCCQDSCMTPGSIISRHLTAVAEGATATCPDQSDVDDFEAEVGGLFIGAQAAAGVTQHRHRCGGASVEYAATPAAPEHGRISAGPALSIEDDRDGYREEIETVLVSRRQRNLEIRRETIRAAGSHVVQQWMTRRASSTADHA